MSGGQPHGEGTVTWKSGDRYEGAFENGHRHGQGVYDYPDGRRYEGAWQEGERAGQGVMTYADGGRYEGGWRKGKQHGAGIVISPEGEITEGVWGGREAGRGGRRRRHRPAPEGAAGWRCKPAKPSSTFHADRLSRPPGDQRAR